MSVFGYWLEASLVIWDGLPGSGKSYLANVTQVDWLLSGNPVITNLAIKSLPMLTVGKPGDYTLLLDSDFDKDDTGNIKLLAKLADIKKRYPFSHPLLVIDECHDIFNARKWKNNDEGGFFTWIAQHRHMGISVLLITQHHSQIDKALRVRAQEFRSFENLVKDNALSMFLWFLSKNIHKGICYPNKNGEPNKKKPHSVKLFMIRKSKARRYSSGQMHKLGLADTFRGRSDWARKLMVAVALAGIFSVISMVSRIWLNHKLNQTLAERRTESLPDIVVPEREYFVEGVYLNEEQQVVMITDFGEMETTGTVASMDHWLALVGDYYVIPETTIPARLWQADILDERKKAHEAGLPRELMKGDTVYVAN